MTIQAAGGFPGPGVGSGLGSRLRPGAVEAGAMAVREPLAT
ncbi:hypothetical protein [Spongiactinospora rosea]|nr:hypothetical protein [Spongiactinospora rosea]